jgi:osmotically-inducible protein OsmY
MLKETTMFLSTLQPSAYFTVAREHGFEKTAIETEFSYLRDVDTSNVSVDISGDFIVLEGVVKTTAEFSRVVKVAREVVGHDSVLSRILVVSTAA